MVSRFCNIRFSSEPVTKDAQASATKSTIDSLQNSALKQEDSDIEVGSATAAVLCFRFVQAASSKRKTMIVLMWCGSNGAVNNSWNLSQFI